MVIMAEGWINERWQLQLPDFRVEFHAARPKWEAGRLDSCADLMQPGMTVYDVGAEHGDFTTLYRQWVDPGEVIPIEPAPHYWPFIRETFEANGFEPPPYSFVGFAGDVTMSGNNAAHVGWPPEADGEGIPDGGFLHLSQDDHTARVTLDDLTERTGMPPDAVIMDIEGAELCALHGMAMLLAEQRPLVWVSVHEPTMLDWYGHRLGDLVGYMQSHRYGAELLPHHGEGETFWLFRPL